MGFDRCHGPFVWSAYAIALTVVLGNIFAVIQRRKKVVDQIRRKLRREQASK
ncbi:MAG: heme exporter protein CcmD [Pseudomonadales bacterium]|nr:heme exporter protein CcmD [Pseudomonadales bacterium]